MTKLYAGYFDGASKGNPGPAGAGAYITERSTGHVVWEASVPLGEQTNNVAEYSGLIALLSYAVENNIESIDIYGDSQLVVKQVTNQWQTKKQHLKPLVEKCQQLIIKIPVVSLNWIPRKENKRADELSNIAIKKLHAQNTPTKNTLHGDIRKVEQNIYLVDSTQIYAVDSKEEHCTCPAFVYGKTRPCKHIIAVKEYILDESEKNKQMGLRISTTN